MIFLRRAVMSYSVPQKGIAAAGDYPPARSTRRGGAATMAAATVSP